MTINSETRVAGPFEGNDSTVTFPFAFKVFDSDELLVVRATDAEESELVLGTDYSVALNPDQNAAPGGSVTLTAPLASLSTLTLTSDLEYLQPLDLTNQGGFYPRVINNAFDRVTILLQQLKAIANRTLKFPLSDGPVGDLPGRAERAGAVLAFDNATGEPIVGPSIDQLGTVAAGMAAIGTVSSNIVDVKTVATNMADVNAVAGSIANVNAVASDLANVDIVAANIEDVNAVADNLTDVSNFSGVYFGPNPSDPSTRRDGSPLQVGDLYFNTSTEELRTYTGSQWRSGVSGAVTVQNLSGDGLETEFLLNYAPDSEIVTQVFIHGVYQQKNTYGIGGEGGATLIFAAAPPAGDDNIEVVVTGLAPTDNVLRDALAQPDGATMIGTSTGTVQDALDGLASPDSGAFTLGRAVVSVPNVAALSGLAAPKLREDLRYALDSSGDGPTSGMFKWDPLSTAPADGWSVIAHGSVGGRFVRVVDGVFALSGVPESVLPASTATPSNAEWYPLDYVVEGNFIFTVVKGSYGGLVDTTCFEIWSFDSAGGLVKKAALSVGAAGQDYRGIAKCGNFVYLCGFTDQNIVVMNVTNPSAPTIERTVPHQYSSGAQHATVANGMLLVSHWGGPVLAAYSLAIPGTPVPIGYQLFSGESPFASSVLDEAGYLWQIVWGTTKNVYCFDVSVPYRKPVLVGSFAFSGLKECRYGQMYNGRLFLAEFQSQGGVNEYGVAEIDVTNPSAPVLVVKHNCNAHTPLVYNDFIIGSMGGTPRKFSAYKMHGDGEVTEFKLNDSYHVYPKIAHGKLIAFRQAGLQSTRPDFVSYDLGLPNDVRNSPSETLVPRTNVPGREGFKRVNGLQARDALVFGDGSSTLLINPVNMPLSYGVNTTLVGNNCGPQLNGGTENTFVGSSSGRNVVTGSKNTALGANALTSSNSTIRTNCTVLGYNAQVTGDNQIQLGDSATTTYVFGTVQNRSDIRDKADVSPTRLGIDFVLGLRAVSGRWDYREDYTILDAEGNTTYYEKDGSKKRTRLHQWFIAQEVEALCATLGVEFGGLQHHAVGGGEDVYSLGYDEFIPPLVQAVQDAWARMDELEARLRKLEE